MSRNFICICQFFDKNVFPIIVGRQLYLINSLSRPQTWIHWNTQPLRPYPRFNPAAFWISSVRGREINIVKKYEGFSKGYLVEIPQPGEKIGLMNTNSKGVCPLKAPGFNHQISFCLSATQSRDLF